MFKQYLNLEEEFAEIYHYIDHLERRKVSETKFFDVKERKFSLISDKIKNISRPQIKEKKVESDNPYKMYPEIDGFINLRSNYTYQPK